MTSIGFSSARLPTVSAIFARRALRSSALARIALSTAGHNFAGQVSVATRPSPDQCASPSVYSGRLLLTVPVAQQKGLRVGKWGCCNEKCSRSGRYYFQHRRSPWVKFPVPRSPKKRNTRALRNCVDLNKTGTKSPAKGIREMVGPRSNGAMRRRVVSLFSWGGGIHRRSR